MAARLVELTLGAPAGRVPDLAGPKVYGMAELIRGYLRERRKHRLIVPVRLPGKAGRAYRAGENLTLDGSRGRRTWEDFLATPHQQRHDTTAEQTGRARNGPAARDFHSRSWRAGNALAGAFARTGIGPFHLLTVNGRRTGRAHTLPVVLVEHDGRRWLVAPYGAVAWVHNARAAGQVTLRRGRHRADYGIREAARDQAGPVLKRYLAIARRTRAEFHAGPDAPVEDFVAEAHRHPVFELVPLGRDTP